MSQRILVTGCAGFIGANLILRLLDDFKDCSIVGIDNLNNYYDVELKRHRLSLIENKSQKTKASWNFILDSISNKNSLEKLFASFKPDIVVNLAAQAGVRYSIDHPEAYIDSNIIGFFNILECCRYSKEYGYEGVQHLVYASSSSVYGSNNKIPYSTTDRVDCPVSLYAATKKSNELMAHAYSKLYKIPSTGLRFFTVYGPAGRPDMAYFKFTRALLAGEDIPVFNYGNCERDFTYIDDIVNGIVKVLNNPPLATENEGNDIPPYALYNIGNSHPVNLLEFITILSNQLKRVGLLSKDFEIKKHIELLPMQPGDVAVTYADTSALENKFHFKPNTSLEDGLYEFAKWYKDFYESEK